ncbi:hypothetical protein GCM10025868_09610 [Angustibacter aerolatus]|uniref:Uncharacterized protein n=1 Tax=Angustibacter aerolatus TaxID=1162965 RepID=A0ABQ6JDR2_9ACTN|nr:hypothetical protein GCM10025868_09610 [Angustibacter aerolatus]
MRWRLAAQERPTDGSHVQTNDVHGSSATFVRTSDQEKPLAPWLVTSSLAPAASSSLTSV